MYIIHHQFVAIILFIQVAVSMQKDIALHYPNRINRSDEDDSGCTTVGVLAQLISLVVFVFYILIIFGLIKACLGLCCSTYIGEIGLDLLLDQPAPDYSRNTQFCMNVVFFLVLPFALFRKIRAGNTLTEKQARRMAAGAESVQKKTKINIIEPQLLTAKKKKGSMDVYRDGNDSETQDTKYVLEQLQKSEQSLRSGMYVCSMVSE